MNSKSSQWNFIVLPNIHHNIVGRPWSLQHATTIQQRIKDAENNTQNTIPNNSKLSRLSANHAENNESLKQQNIIVLDFINNILTTINVVNQESFNTSDLKVSDSILIIICNRRSNRQVRTTIRLTS